MSAQMKWTFPMLGITETASDKIDFSFKTKCRNKITDQLSVNLPGLDFKPGKEEEFVWKLQVPEDKEAVVMRSMVLQPIVTRIRNPTDPLVFRMEFLPFKPFKSNAELVVDKTTGGRWKFVFELEATEPDFDDVILIESPLQKTSSVAFRLPNTAPS